MDQRRSLAYQVLVQGVSLSQAAREFGVSRPTARLWRDRAIEMGIGELAESSRRPRESPTATDASLIEALLEARRQYPFWGAKKLLEVLWPGERKPLSLRTANRVIARAGLVGSHPGEMDEPVRFEREHANELWQMDFKGMKHPRLPYEAFSVIDDATRFSLAFCPVADQSVNTVWSVLWELFGDYGLPECMLSDNGPAFRAGAGRLPSTLHVRLMRLGIRSTHGRPYHPQTQGKVERFNGTVQRELGRRLRQPSALEATSVYETFRARYNWQRPHEALDMRVPGSLYARSARPRPDLLPEHEIPSGAISRKVDDFGNIGFKSGRYKVGRGLAKERVVIADGHLGYVVTYFGIDLGLLEDFRV